jgi:hypothetical protein
MIVGAGLVPARLPNLARSAKEAGQGQALPLQRLQVFDDLPLLFLTQDETEGMPTIS